MMMYEQPPEYLAIDGIQYPIITDFRRWIEVYSVICGEKSNEDKAEYLARFMQENGLPLNQASLNVILQFINGQSTRKGGGKSENKKAFDFTKDSGYIFAAFLSTYDIDLTVVQMHWWKFLSLFQSLPEDCQMCKIMHYRLADTSKMSKEQKKFYEDMKRHYSLDADRPKMTLEERNRMMIEQMKRANEKAKSQMSALQSSK